MSQAGINWERLIIAIAKGDLCDLSKGWFIYAQWWLITSIHCKIATMISF